MDDRIRKMHEAAAAKREAGELIRKNPMEKAAENPKSLRLAVNAKCYDCVGQDGDPGWRDRVRDCGCEKSCALYPVRPFQ